MVGVQRPTRANTCDFGVVYERTPLFNEPNRTEQLASIVRFVRTEHLYVRTEPNRTLQYGYQIKWNLAATCEKLVDFVLTRLFIALDMHVNHSMNIIISQVLKS